MFEDILLEIGLTKSEIAVYLALLDLGSSTTGPIVNKAKIASGKSYLILNKLIDKGLVSYLIKSGIKFYQSKDPERLLDYLKQKENEIKNKQEKLEKILPQLKSKYNEEKYRPMAEIYEGYGGIKTFYEFVLKEIQKGDVICIFGAPRELMEKFNDYFIDWNKRRIKIGAIMKVIYNSDCIKYGKAREKMRLTEVRYMKKDVKTPAWGYIFRCYVGTLNLRGIPVCFLMKSKESADSYREYFEVLWKQAKP